jgi:hypothetical protein
MPVLVTDGIYPDVKKYRIPSFYQQFSGSQYTLLYNCTKHAFIQYYTAVVIMAKQLGKGCHLDNVSAKEIDALAWASISTTLGDDVNPFSWMFEEYVETAAFFNFKAEVEEPHPLGYTHFAGKLWTHPSRWTYDPKRVIPKLLTCTGQFTPMQNLMNKWSGYQLESGCMVNIPILTKLSKHATINQGRPVRERVEKAGGTHMGQAQVDEIWDYDYPVAREVDAQIDYRMDTETIIEILIKAFPVTEPLAIEGGTVLTTKGDYIVSPGIKNMVDPMPVMNQLYKFSSLIQTYGVKVNLQQYSLKKYVQHLGNENGIFLTASLKELPDYQPGVDNGKDPVECDPILGFSSESMIKMTGASAPTPSDSKSNGQRCTLTPPGAIGFSLEGHVAIGGTQRSDTTPISDSGGSNSLPESQSVTPGRLDDDPLGKNVETGGTPLEKTTPLLSNVTNNQTTPTTMDESTVLTGQDSSPHGEALSQPEKQNCEGRPQSILVSSAGGSGNSPGIYSERFWFSAGPNPGRNELWDQDLAYVKAMGLLLITAPECEVHQQPKQSSRGKPRTVSGKGRSNNRFSKKRHANVTTKRSNRPKSQQ